MSGPILVFVELGTGDAAGEADRVSLETLALARSLAGALGGAAVEALLIGGDAAAVASTLGDHGVASAHVVSDRGRRGRLRPRRVGRVAGRAGQRARCGSGDRPRY